MSESSGSGAASFRNSRLSLTVAAAVSVAIALVYAGSSLAEVQTVIQSGGPPELPHPTYQETGLPDFTMPIGKATFPDGTPVPTTVAAPGVGGVSGAGGASVATSWASYDGQAVGSGQCVALLQAADPGVGLTRTWAQGAQVQGNTALVPGTAIATFDSNGTYGNHLDGSSHAAIYLGQNAQGIQVMDQWAGSPAAYRTIRWSGSAKAANTGSAFYVVQHA